MTSDRAPPPGLIVYRIAPGASCNGGEEIALALVTYAPGDAARLPTLTPAERAVVAALLAGHSNDEIARARGTALRTVANQVARIFKKMGVRSRAELAVRWSSQ